MAKKTAKKTAKKKAAKKTTKKKQVNRSAGGDGAVDTKGATWNFPKHTLEESLRVAQAIEDKYAGHPTEAPHIAKAIGFNKARDWRFLNLLRASSQYGLTEGTGARTSVSLEPIGEGVVSPSDPSERVKALWKAFYNVDLFKKVDQHYSGKKIPEDEYFENTLVRTFDVARDRVSRFIEIFTSNRKYLASFTGGGASDEVSKDPAKPQDHVSVKRDPPARRRQYLNTCFVLMPFGGYYDTYYREIYTPAIEAAGLESVRADSLFSSGSVVEQIWDELNKARVLIAELTDKNANVFYELGLSHAIAKPVVIVTGNLEDVPFDLRHLRVIVYDVRAPGWDDKLQEDLTEYIRAAQKDPQRSIPQPFRDLVSDVDLQDDDEDDED
ncbi:MAG: hypothetical protein ACF8MF_10520 [Phycisphaerales bacterium JB052]